MEDFDSDFDVKNIKQEEFSSQSELLVELTKPPISLKRSREPRKIVEKIQQPVTESAAARRRRLQVKRQRAAARKLKEPPESLERRLKIEREKQAERLCYETPEARERRLQLDRERKAEQRRNESPESRERRLQRDRDRKKRINGEQRRNESPESRERRLQGYRDSLAQRRRAQNSPFSPSTSSSTSWATQSKCSNKTNQKKNVYSDRDSNSCRFCLAARGEKKIPTEFFKVYESYYGVDFDYSEKLPQKICTICFKKANDCLRFLKSVKDSQPKVREILDGMQDTSHLLEVEIDSAVISMQDDPIGDVPLIPVVKTEWLDNDVDFNSFHNEDNSKILGYDQKKPKYTEKTLLMHLLTESEIPIEIETQKVEVSLLETEPKRQIVKSTKKNKERYPNHRYRAKTRTCDICGFEYNSIGGIKKHIYEHIKKNLPAGKPFKCEECELSFSSKWLRWKHKASTHFDKSEFVCDECGKQHQDIRQLRVHKRQKHSPKVICTYCAAFICEGAMTIHIARNHKLVKCEYCDLTFEGRNGLHNHNMTKHSREPLTCPHCQAAFNDMKMLREHLKSFHGETELHCLVEGCSFLTETRALMKAHLRYHKDIEESLRERLLAEIDLFRAARGRVVQQNV